MNSEKNSYKQILKATSLFGGAQSITILISVVKTKVAALLIGVSGVGIFGVIMSTLNLIQGITRCGLDVTAVKEIASSNKDEKLKIISLISKLTLIIGILGTFVILISSSWLSLLAFKNKAYTLFFVTSSIAVLFNQLTTGNIAILQGLKSLKRLTKVIIFSSVFSLLPTVILYYLYEQDGIPWVILSTAFISFLVSHYFLNKQQLKKQPISRFLNASKAILKPGMYLSLANIVTLAIAYVIQIVITNIGGVQEVGYFNAGFTLIHSYMAVFFSGLSKDFFPRLSEVAKNHNAVNKMVNEQAYVLLLLMTPLIILFVILKPFIVTLLYSKEFLPILGMITFGILSTVFKSVSWSMGFIFLAKGDTKLYFKTELLSHILLLIMVYLGYYTYGLTGIGVGYLVYHVLDFIFIKWVVTKWYKFYFNSNFNKLFYICIFQFVILIAFFYITNENIKNGLMLLVFLASSLLSIFKLKGHFNFQDLFKHQNKE